MPPASTAAPILTLGGTYDPSAIDSSQTEPPPSTQATQTPPTAFESKHEPAAQPVPSSTPQPAPSPQAETTPFKSKHVSSEEETPRALPADNDFVSRKANPVDVGTNFTSRYSQPSAEEQVAAAPTPAGQLTQGVDTSPQLNLGSSSTPALGSDINPALDKSIHDTATSVTTSPRIDTTFGDLNSPATDEQIQKIANSPKNPYQLAAQDQISMDTLDKVLMLKSKQWNDADAGGKFKMVLGTGAQVLGDVLTAYHDTVVNELSPLLKGKLGPFLGGTVKLAQDIDAAERGILAPTSIPEVAQGVPAPVTPSGAPKTWEQVQVPFGAKEVPGETPPVLTQAQKEAENQAEAERQRLARTLLSAGENVVTTGRNVLQSTLQNTADLFQNVNTWLGMTPQKLGGNLFDHYGVDLRGVPYEQLPDPERSQYNQARVNQIRDEGAQLVGDSNAVNHVLSFMRGNGRHVLTPLELQAYGKGVDPQEVQAASLGLQLLATHYLPELPGFDEAIDRLSEGAVNTMRLPIRAADLTLKGLSGLAKNEIVGGMLGAIGGINTAWHAVKAGDFSPLSIFGGPYYGAKIGAAAAKKGVLSKVFQIADVPFAYGENVLKTAADEASNGAPFWGDAAGDFGKWVPPWVRNASQAILPEGSMAQAGPLTRFPAKLIGQTARTGVSSALLAPAFTQSPEDAGSMIGQMAALGGVTSLPGAAGEAFHAPFDHIFVPKYDPHIKWGKTQNAPYRNYGTDPDLDKLSKATIEMFPQATQDKINNLREVGMGKWEVYPVNDESLQNIAQASSQAKVSKIEQQIDAFNKQIDDARKSGDYDSAQRYLDIVSQLQKDRVTALAEPAAALTSHGFYFRDGVDGEGPKQAFVRASSVDKALGHEGLGHPVWDLMQRLYPDKAAAFLDAAKKTTNMDVFANDYVRRLSNGGNTDATYNNLPPGITSADIDSELAAEHGAGLLDGANATTWTKNPTWQRNLVMGVGSVLEHVLGIPITGAYSRHEFAGFNGSIGAALRMDQAIRAITKDPNTLRPWEAPEAPPQKPKQGPATGEAKSPPEEPETKPKQGETKPAEGQAPEPPQEPPPHPADPDVVKALKALQFTDTDAKFFASRATGANTAEIVQDALRLSRERTEAQKAELEKQRQPDVNKQTQQQINEIAEKALKERGFTPEEIEEHMPKDAKNAWEAIQAARANRDKANPPKETPEQFARRLLANPEAYGWTPEQMDKHVPKDARTKAEAVQRAIESNRAEQKAAEEQFKPSPEWQEVPGTIPREGLPPGGEFRKIGERIEGRWPVAQAAARAQIRAKTTEPPEVAKKPAPPNWPVQPPAPPQAPVQPAPAPQISNWPVQPPALPPVEEQAPKETTETTAPDQKALREEGIQPGAAQNLVTGNKPRIQGERRPETPQSIKNSIHKTQSWKALQDDIVSGKLKPPEGIKAGTQAYENWLGDQWTDRMKASGEAMPKDVQDYINAPANVPRGAKGETKPPLSHTRANLGAFGYPGDTTWDTNSLQGKGAFHHTSRAGSLIPLYSAALSDEGARLRHVVPGQEFLAEDGHSVFRYDDRIPDSSHVPANYIDVYCYTPDTEILTRRGWITFSDVSKADEVATRNPKTRLFQWQHPTAIISTQYSGPMVHFEGAIDLVVTPEHRMLLGRDRSLDEWISSAIDAHKQFSGNHHVRIPSTSRWIGYRLEHFIFSYETQPRVNRSNNKSGQKGVHLVAGKSWKSRNRKWVAYIEICGKRINLGSFGTFEEAKSIRLNAEKQYQATYSDKPYSKTLQVSGDNFCALMGAYISEGCCNKSGIVICQRQESKGFKPFKELFDKMGCGAGYSPSLCRGAFYISGLCFREYFRKFGHSHEKFVPEEIMSATPDQIRIFLQYYMLGDGFIQNLDPKTFERIEEGGRIRAVSGTTSKKLADQLQELWQKIGYSASVTSDKQGMHRRRYIVTVRLQATSLNPGHSFSSEIETYSGTVHCVSVPNGLVYVRRNGKPAWCGNSPDHAPDPGVSAAQIARNRAIMDAAGIGSAGVRGPLTAGEQPRGPLSLGQSVTERSVFGPPQQQLPQAPSAPKEEAQPAREVAPRTEEKTPTIPPEEPVRQAVTPQMISDTEQQYRDSVPQGRKSEATYADDITRHVLETVGTAHAQSLAPGDTRVTWHPETGMITGTHFVQDGSDAFHNWLLSRLNPTSAQHELDVLRQIESAIAERRDLSVDYASAPSKEKGLATGAGRKEEQAESPASARAKGEAEIQLAGKHNVLPSYVGITQGKKGEPSTIIYGGLDPSKISENAAQLTNRLATKSPYKTGPIGDSVAEEDLHGILGNYANGWDGTGTKKLTPVEGVTLPQEQPGFEPYNLSTDPVKAAAKRDFWNIAINGPSKLSPREMEKGAKTSSGRAALLAKENAGFITPEGHVNPLHRQIEMETPGWSKENLHAGWQMLRCYDSSTEVLTRKGWKFFKDLLPVDMVATRNTLTKKFEWQLPTAWLNSHYSGEMIHFYSQSLDLFVTPDHRMLCNRNTHNDGSVTLDWVSSANDLSDRYSGNSNVGIPMTSQWDGVPIGDKIFRVDLASMFRRRGKLCPGVTWNKRSKKWFVRIGINGKMLFLGEYSDFNEAKLIRQNAEDQYKDQIQDFFDARAPATKMSGNDFCALVGAYLSEGSIRGRNGRSSHQGIVISQNPESKGFKIFAELIQRIQGRVSYTRRASGGGLFVIPRQSLSDYFIQFGHAHEKYIPDDIMDATSDQIRIFLHYYLLGDGYSRGVDISDLKNIPIGRKSQRQRGSKRIDREISSYTVSKRLADQLVELWQKIGYSASVKKLNVAGTTHYTSSGVVIKQRKMGYRVNVIFSKRKSFNSKRIQYSGSIHCVEVPNGIIYVRRNGKHAWCGNSDLTKKIRPAGSEGAAPIHTGHEGIAKALQEKSQPPHMVLKSGFMPGELKAQGEAEKPARGLSPRFMPSEAFTSPNYGEGKKFEDVAPDFTGENHRQAKEYFGKIDRTISKMAGSKKTPEQIDAFGDYPTNEGAQSAETSVLTNWGNVPYSLVKAGEAAKALHQGQLSTLIWEDHAQGPHVLHTITTDLSPEKARDLLTKHGIAYRTILADRKPDEPTTIKLFNSRDQYGDISDNVKGLLSDPEASLRGDPTHQRGRGEFIGSTGEHPSRDEAAREYRRVSQSAQESRRDLDWKDYNNHWDEAENHYAKIKGASGRVNWMPGELLKTPEAIPAEHRGRPSPQDWLLLARIEQDYAHGNTSKAEAIARIRQLGQDPDEYIFFPGSHIATPWEPGGLRYGEPEEATAQGGTVRNRVSPGQLSDILESKTPLSQTPMTKGLAVPRPGSPETLSPRMQMLHKLWRSIGDDKSTFKYNLMGPEKDIKELAKQISTPKEPVTTQESRGHINLKTPRGEITIYGADTDEPEIGATEARSMGTKGGGGAQLYQLAFKWAANNGKKILSHSLTDVNELRRTSNMLASALREGSTAHLSPSPQQRVDWREGQDEHNLAELARRESELAHNRIGNLKNFGYDFINHEFYHRDSDAPASDRDIEEAIRAQDPSFSRGVGLATAKRALITDSAEALHEALPRAGTIQTPPTAVTERIAYMPAEFTKREREMFDSAANTHGLTDNVYAAGYTLPDGRMLNFHRDDPDGGENHSDVQYKGAPVKRPDDPGPAKNKLIQSGAMRMDVRYGGVEFGPKTPTAAQMGILGRSLVEGSGLAVDVVDKDGIPMMSRVYDPETRPGKILGDILRAQRGEALSSRAFWMPGDAIQSPTGEREIVKSRAMRVAGKIYEAPLHAWAKENAEEDLGRKLKKGEAEEGFTTVPTKAFPEGRFIDRPEAWRLAQENKQIREGAKPLEQMQLYKNQKTGTGGKMEGLAGEDLTAPGARWMPGEQREATNLQGAPVRETTDYNAESAPGEIMRYKQPGVHYMPFAGESATGYGRAKEEGRTFIGPYDQRPRFEIDDSKAVFKKPTGQLPGSSTPLKDILQHPELYENYPELADLPVYMRTMRRGISASYSPPTDWQAFMEGSTGHINMRKGATKADLIHEVQHAIQQIEQYPQAGRGSSAPIEKQAMMLDRYPWELREKAQAEYDKVDPRLSFDDWSKWNQHENPQIAGEQYDKYLAKRAQERAGYVNAAVLQAAPYGRYWRNPGEIEAREAARRTPLSESKRAAIPPDIEHPGELPPSLLENVPARFRPMMERAAHYMPMAGEKGAGYEEAQREGRTFMSPYQQRSQYEISDHDMKWKHPMPPPSHWEGFTYDPDVGKWATEYKGKILHQDFGPEMDPHDAYKLGDLIDHPALFHDYPDAKKINVVYNPRMDGASFDTVDPQDKRATGLIQISEPTRKDLLIHEIQHWIQNKEDFPSKGTNLSQAGERISPAHAADIRENASADFDKKFGTPTIQDFRELVNERHPDWTPAQIDKEANTRQLEHDENRAAYVRQQVRAAQHAEYSKNVGEIEAREAARRIAMTPEERAANPPFNPKFISPEKAYFMAGNDALPNVYHTNERGEQVAKKIPFDITHAPIIADKQPDKITKDSPDNLPKDRFEYLSEPARKRLSALDENSATGTFANKIVSQAKKWMKNPEIAAGAGWYSRMVDLLGRAFKEDHELFSHLLGVTSPNEKPLANFLYALEAYDLYKAGKFAKAIDLYQKAYEMKKSGTLINHVQDVLNKNIPLNKEGKVTDAAAMAVYIKHHDILPQREGGLLFGYHGMGILRALAKTWMEESNAPKTKNYAQNLFGSSKAATIDVWASRMMRRLGYSGRGTPWRILEESEKAPSNIDFAFSQLAFDKAAKKLGMEPHDLQAICWFGEKQHWLDKAYSSESAAEKSSLDVPFHATFPQGPEGPRLPYSQVRAKFSKQLAPEESTPEEEEPDWSVPSKSRSKLPRLPVAAAR